MNNITNNTELSIISTHTGWTFENIQSLGYGYGGLVFRADTPDVEVGRCVIKVIPHYPEACIEDETFQDRVYGARWSNFLPAYQLMKEHQLPVPCIYTSDTLKNFDFIIMEYLSGISVREHLEDGIAQNERDLHQVTGMYMGRLHAIKRPYQGWITEPPYKKSWRAAFLSALEANIKNLSDNPLITKEQLIKMDTLIDEFSQKWTDPKEFVLSHTDGFQGIAEFSRSKTWHMKGIIDIEDHQFTDPRFVLAGHELSVQRSGKNVPEVFWQSYHDETDMPPNYTELRKYFMLFYLTCWIDVLSNPNLGTSEERSVLLDKTNLTFKNLLLS